MKKTFLICPVRGHDPNEFLSVVYRLELVGWKVHYPPKDTNQDDPSGYDICTQNRKAIEDADAVHIIWDGKSQGCLFDLGMAFALNKELIIISIPEFTEGKSFQNMMAKWAFC
jgi:nucleoside 2-deoxyribosyltransferase